MADTIIQDIPAQGENVMQYFTMVYRESPLARPVEHKVPIGCTVSDIKSKAPKGDFQVIVAKGAEILNDDYEVSTGDIVDVTLVPAEVGSTIALIVALTTLAIAGYMLYTQEDLKGDSTNEKELRIRGLRNRERLYESVPVILGKRKVAPMFWARPWTEFVGEDEYFNIMLSAGYGPLKLTNFRLGEVPLNQYDHEMAILDYYGYNDKSAVRKLWENDIVQDNVEIELVEGSGWTTRNTATSPDYISVDFNFPAGVYRTNSEGKFRTRYSCIQYQYRNGTDWYTLTTITNPLNLNNLSGVPHSVFTQGGQYFVRNANGTNTNITSYFDRIEGSLYFFKNLPDSIKVTSVYYGNNTPKPARRGVKHLVPETLTGNIVTRCRKIHPLASEENPKAVDTTFWSTLKTHRNLSDTGFDSIIGADRQPLVVDGVSYDVFKPTIIVLRIKATNQLNGMLDNLYCDAEMVVPSDPNVDWRLWQTLPKTALIPSDNPADAYRWLLQGPMNTLALANDRVDIDTLLYWRQKNIDEGWKISNFIETEGTLLKELNNVAFTGRAEYGFVDGKHSVIVKEKRLLPVQVFTPKNSDGFTSTRGYPEDIDGIKITFNSELVDFERDEIIFKDPIKEANPILLNGKFRSIDLWGVTNPDLAYRHGRFSYYEQALRREIYKFKTDIEGIRCSRGDLIRIQNDVINVGYGAGRIKQITPTTIKLDETVDTDQMVSPLALQVRTPLGAIVAIPATYLGDGVWQCTPPSDAMVGDLVVYGQLGKVTLDAIVTELDYAEDLVVNITATNAANEMYDFDGNPIPEYQTSVTELPSDKIPLAPYVVSPVAVNPRTGVVSVVLDLPPNSRSSGVSYQVQYRLVIDGQEDENSFNWIIGAVTTDGFVDFSIPNLVAGNRYEVRARARGTNNLYSYWSNVVAIEVPQGLVIDPVRDISVSHTKDGTFISWRSVDFNQRTFTEVHKKIQNPASPFNVVLGVKSELSYVDQILPQKINIGYLNILNWDSQFTGLNRHVYGLFERTDQGVYSTPSVVTVNSPPTPAMSTVTGESINGVMRLMMTSNSVYPISYYEVRSALESTTLSQNARLIGRFEEGNCSFQEDATGTYYYHVKIVDIAGNSSGFIVQALPFTATQFDINSILPEVIGAVEEEIQVFLDNAVDQLPSVQEIQDLVDSALNEINQQELEDPRVSIVDNINSILDSRKLDKELELVDFKLDQTKSDLQKLNAIDLPELRDELTSANGQIAGLQDLFPIQTISVADNVITNSKIVDGAINDVKIATNAITNSKIVDGAINDVKIATNAITNSKIVDGAINDVKIAINAITSTKIADNVITNSKIVDGAINDVKIATNAITSTKIADNVITSPKIVSNAILADKISAGAVIADKIAANAVTAEKILAGSILADKIAANAVTAVKIAADAVTAEKILAGSILADKIAANAVTAVKIAANSVLADKISAGAVIADKIAANAVTATKILAGAVEADKIAVNAITADKILANSVTSEKILAGAVTTDKMTANTINGDRILAGSLSADKITANTISANQIAVNAITTDKINALAVNASKLEANSVVADKIAADAVTAVKIAAGSIVADKIATGAITATKIAAGAITSDKIEANAITASKISADALDGKLITGTILRTTSSTTTPRVVIGEPVLPLWYGTGAVSSANGAFYVNNLGTAYAQNMVIEGTSVFRGNLISEATITGGNFRSSASGYRAEMSGAGSFPFWYGTGTKTLANALFAVDNGGNLYIKDAVITNGQSREIGTQFMTITDVNGFGASNDLIEWYGPKINGVTWNTTTLTPILTGMTKANARTYKTVTGGVYFGGTFSAGVRSNSLQTTILTANPVRDMTFSSNGGLIEIAASLSYDDTDPNFSQTICPNPLPAAPFATVFIEQFVDGVWQVRGQTTFNGSITCLAGGGGDPRIIQRGVGGTVTFTDSALSASNRTYRARAVINNYFATNNTIQSLSITSAEE